MPCRCVAYAFYFGLSLSDLPRLVRIEIDYWQNKSWGFYNIDRKTTQCEIAVSSSGSRSTRCVVDTFRHYFQAESHRVDHILYRRPPHALYDLDHEQGVAIGGDCKCGVWRLDPPKSDCLQSAVARGFMNPKTRGTIGGIDVDKFEQTDEDGAFHEIAFAPSYDCEVMDEVRRWKGTLGIPGALWHRRITSYEAGEPDSKYFEVPTGYRVEPEKR